MRGAPAVLRAPAVLSRRGFLTLLGAVPLAGLAPYRLQRLPIPARYPGMYGVPSTIGALTIGDLNRIALEYLGRLEPHLLTTPPVLTVLRDRSTAGAHG